MNRLKRRMAARGADTPAALYKVGLGHLRAGRHLEAQICCQRALALDAGHADTLHLLGLVALEAGQNDHAVEWFSRAVHQANKADHMSSLGGALQRVGRFEEASKVFEKALELKPDAQGWRNLANVLFDLRRWDAALLAYRQVLDLEPRDWDAACRSGYLHYQAGRLEEALACFGICDALRPNQASILYLRSASLHGLGRFEQAVTEGMRGHALSPADADICNTIGASLQALYRHEAALPWFDRALDLRPGFDSALYNKAVSLGKLRRIDEVLVIHDRLRAGRGPGSLITDLHLADLLISIGRREDALAWLNLCHEKHPNHAPTLQIRSVCLYQLNQFERSLADSLRAYELDPKNAGICNNLGSVLHALGRREEALSWFEKAIELQPNYVDALNNKASTLAKLHRLADAASTYDRVRAIDPDNAAATLGTADLDLLNGHFEAGWAGREARWKVPNLPIVYPRFSQPMWRGQTSIAGKTILIYADEGMGDAIQCARYLPMMASLGARVILVVHAPLRPLLSGLAGVSQCIANNSTEPIPSFDTYCPMMSLPLAFGTRLDTIPAEIPYLPDPAADRVRAWNERLPPRGKLRVGLAWSGNPNHTNDAYRSIPLAVFARFLDIDATFVRLQKDLSHTDRSTFEKLVVVDLTAHLTDMGETAALMCCLDLVITVDTSTAHLAGALGLPVWILLPYTPDCRWLLDRDDSPWYPTARLFRQTATRDWAEVLGRVRGELVRITSFQPE